VSGDAQRRKLGVWLKRNARPVLRALASSDRAEHEPLAAELAEMIGANLDRLDDLPKPPSRMRPEFLRRDGSGASE